MRFIIASSQGHSNAPDGTPSGIMQILDMIEARSADDAEEVFREDNEGIRGSGFTEFICIPLADDIFRSFRFGKE